MDMSARSSLLVEWGGRNDIIEESLFSTRLREFALQWGTMEKPLITSLSNPLIKQARALRQRKARAESGLFLVEGIHHVGEAVDAGWGVDSILYAPDLLASDFARDLIARVSSSAPQPVSAQVMESLADKENPQGILAIVHQNEDAAWRTSAISCGRGDCLAARPGQCRGDPAYTGRGRWRCVIYH